MASYGQGYPGSAAGQPPGAPQGGYYSGQQYGGGGGYPGYGAPAAGAAYGSPNQGRPYGQPGQGGAVPGGHYGGQAHGGSYGMPGNNPYGGQQPGHYGHGSSGNIPTGVDPEAFSWFQSVDTDRSGNITFKELKQALVNTNWSTFNDETCVMMINMFDKTGTGRIDVFGFSALWRFVQQWKTMFQQFDRDRSGNISHGELHQALSQMGYTLSPQLIQLIMSRYGQRSANPTLQLDRFIQVCTQLQSMTEAFREKDTGRSGNARLSYEDFLTMTATRLI